MDQGSAQEIERHSLIAGIRRAFGDVQLGAGVSLHQAIAMDDYLTKEEIADARQHDTDTHWWEIPDETIAGFGSALSFVDAEGFRYYLPRFHALCPRELGKVRVGRCLVCAEPPPL